MKERRIICLLGECQLIASAVLGLDGDLYESTIQALGALYPQLSPGVFCIIDDYVLKPCRQAVTDYHLRWPRPRWA
jgi:hypothetical protein